MTNQKLQLPPRPRSINVYIVTNILMTVVVLAFATLLVLAKSGSEPTKIMIGLAYTGFMALMVIIFLLILLYNLAKGRNWMRYLLGACSVFGVVSTLIGIVKLTLAGEMASVKMVLCWFS